MKNIPIYDIENREDIYKLVSSFYQKIRKQEVLGPIFNHIIKDWDEHIERLTDFWETNLLFVAKFKGNPIVVHQHVDSTFKGSITEKHFGIWLHLWVTTTDSLFEGERAEIAKRRARKMSTHLYLSMNKSRTSNTITCPTLDKK